MTASVPLLAVSALGLALAAVGGNIGSPLITSIGLLSVALVATPLAAARFADIAGGVGVSGAGK